MRARLVMALMSVAALPGCTAGAFVIYDGSKNQSREVAATIMAQKMPGVDPDAAAACVVKGMTYKEILAIGTSDIDPVNARHRATVDLALTRPEVAKCLAALPETAEAA